MIILKGLRQKGVGRLGCPQIIYILGEGGVGVDLVWIDFTDICGNSDLNGLLNLMKVK